MNAIEVLTRRVSISRLAAPAPDESQRQVIFAAALRAADHGQMRPWRFLVVEGNGLHQLGEVYASAAAQEDPELPEAKREKFRSMPLRAPMVIVAIACTQANVKVPEIEQVISAGAAVQNMLNAAYALNVGAFWRSGDMAYSPAVKKSLNLSESEQIVGYLYLGTPTTSPEPHKPLEITQFFHPWPAK
ncbi:nitroreductase family protein [Cellvibrio polysaccharolyticus]|uniref:Putative NAD(P)H nitroreductase n=1 Tax=Cellvibrio polysaccharolyticus TaxID=2082724 RepID=A0A928YU66_9GAMM|nr:nitroreductase [Cellvibrio polysaccharolyticus]MBE8717120.1 nitroreductase [Cellvibrio polysaccharolyticus]